MKKEDVDKLREIWKIGTWDDGTPVDVSVEWVLIFTIEELIQTLKEKNNEV